MSSVGEQASRSRRPHTKSRTGCTDCRKRRVKCTEERPKCRSCLRRGVACEYPAQPLAAAPVASPHSPATEHHSPSVRTVGSDIQQNEPAEPQGLASSRGTASPSDATPLFSTSSLPSIAIKEFDLSDLALMHHWTVSTSMEIYKDPALSHIWQIVFPRVGFQYPFVARAILSLAALHLAHLNRHEDSSSYILSAIRLHDMALDGFQAAVRHITAENSEALLAWSILNVLYVLSISKHHIDRNISKFQDPYRDRVLGMELIPMMRGVPAVLAPTYEFIKQGRIDSLMNIGNWFELDPDQQTPLPGSMDDSFCRTRESWAESGDATIYEDSLKALRRCIMFMDQFASMDQAELRNWGWNRAWAGPLMFIFFAPERYFTLVHQRQPAALILYAHFGCLLHRLNDHWFFEGWGRDIVEVVSDLVGSYWRPWIRWPLEFTAQT